MPKIDMAEIEEIPETPEVVEVLEADGETTCPECGKDCKTSDGLKGHLRLEHNAPTNERKERATSGDPEVRVQEDTPGELDILKAEVETLKAQLEDAVEALQGLKQMSTVMAALQEGQGNNGKTEGSGVVEESAAKTKPGLAGLAKEIMPLLNVLLEGVKAAPAPKSDVDSLMASMGIMSSLFQSFTTMQKSMYQGLKEMRYQDQGQPRQQPAPPPASDEAE